MAASSNNPPPLGIGPVRVSDEAEKTSALPPPTDAIPRDEEEAGAEAVGQAPADHGSTLRGFRLYAVAIGVCFGALMMSLDISILGTALPSIMTDLGDSSSNIAWYPAAFTLATCALTPVAGKLASVFRLDLVYSSFTLVFLVGSILCGWAPSSSAFIAGRAIAGIGAAGVASNGLVILVTAAPPTKKPVFMGAGAACFVIGLIAGPLLGGAFTDRLTWRWCFWINIPFNILTLTVVSLFFRRPRQEQVEGRSETGISERIQSLDLIGCIIFVPGIFMFLLAMQTGSSSSGSNGTSWSSGTVVGLFVGSGVVLAAFVAWEWQRGSQAMIPGTVVMRRSVVFVCLFASTQMGALTVAAYYLPAWFQAIQGVGPLQSGVRMLPTVVTQMLVTIVASGLAMRIKYYNPWFFLAPIFMCTSSVLYTTFTVSSTPASHWIGYQVIQGFATGFGMQMSSLCVQLELKDSPELVPVGIALVMFVQYLGATVVQVIAGTVFNSELSSQLGRIALTPSQRSALLGVGIKGIREVTEKRFPLLLDSVLEAYNTAITRVFFVPAGAATLGFSFAFGIKWTRIEGAAAAGGRLARLRAARAAKAVAKAEQKQEPKT
ncbi:MFS transporter [Lasiosphaeria ovina]|uniref:MFS transporter n=1 Tax=Lasiosphaeria ovina TaxID=92902 RepID=A0AAE0KGX2_9PEZI|nr:MFS transporter [Lasiosphaeria ovina]